MRGSLSARSPRLALGHYCHQPSMVLRSVVASRALPRAASKRVFIPRRPCGVAAQTSGCRGSQRSQETIQNLGCWGGILLGGFRPP
jgi:hypothetical protein